MKLAVIVAAAGGVGVAIGYGLATYADDNQAGTLAGADTTTATTSTASAVPRPTPQPAAAPTTSTAATVTQNPSTTTTTTTSTTPAKSPRDGVTVRVLGAILRPAGTPSGVQRNRARITMRLRAQNQGTAPATVDLPRLRIGGSVIRPDSNVLTPASQFGELAAGEAKSITLRFELAGDTTAKATSDRRAQIDVAGRSETVRITIGRPVAIRANEPGTVSP